MPADKPHSRQILAETPYLRLVQEGHWTYAQRPHKIGAIAVAALTDEDQLLLVEQYRIPVAQQAEGQGAGRYVRADCQLPHVRNEPACASRRSAGGTAPTSRRVILTPWKIDVDRGQVI